MELTAFTVLLGTCEVFTVNAGAIDHLSFSVEVADSVEVHYRLGRFVLTFRGAAAGAEEEEYGQTDAHEEHLDRPERGEGFEVVHGASGVVV